MLNGLLKEQVYKWLKYLDTGPILKLFQVKALMEKIKKHGVYSTYEREVKRPDIAAYKYHE